MVFAAAPLSAQDNPSTGDLPKPAETKPTPEDWERLIYLPYKNLRTVFEKEGAAAFMPYGQFLKMWEKLQTTDMKGPTKPPVNAVITEAAYVGKIEKDVAKIEANLTIQVLGKPWVELPIQFGDAAIGKMTASDDKVLLQGTGNGTYALLFPKAGEQKIKLELTTKVRTSPDGRSLELECPASGITNFELSVPAADQTVEVTPQAAVSPVGGDEKITRIKANLGATKKIAARWRPRVSTAPVMEVLTSVQNVLDVRLADGLVHSHATLTYTVLRGQLDQLRIGVPLDHRILDVTAPGMKAWKSAKEEKSQVITVDLLSGDAKSIAVEVHTERPAPQGAFDIAGVAEDGTYRGIHALGEVRENGFLVVGQAADLSLTVDEQSGLVRVEAGEIPEALRRPESQFYKFYTPKLRLLVTAKPVEPRLLADHRTQLVFREDEVQLTSHLTYTVERAGVFELRFAIPEGLKVDRVDCEPMKEFQAPEGMNQLIISLREKTKGQIAVTVTGHIPVDPAKKDFAALPLLEPQGLARENGTIFVFAPEAIEVITDEKKVQGAQPNRPDASQIQAVANARLASAWTYTRKPDIPVRTERKPTRLTASIGTTINIYQDRAEVVSLVNYNVQFAGIDTFRLAVPEAVAENVQIEPVDPSATPVKQKQKAEAAEEGWIPWTVVLQREATGNVAFRVRYDLKLKLEKGDGTLPFSVVRVLDTPGKTEGAPAVALASILGEITVQKDKSLAVAAKGEALEAIDVRELTLLPQEGTLAYRYYKQPEKLADPFTLELSVSKHDIQEVVETVIDRALVEAVVTEDKSVTYRARYRLKSSERQRLAVDLPKDSEILDLLVAGNRVAPEKADAGGSASAWDSYRVNVARKTASDEPFVLSIVFRAPFKDSPLRGRGGNLRLNLPRIGGANAADTHKIALQELRIAVWVPKEFSLVGTPSGFTPDQTTHFDLIRGAIGYAPGTTNLDQWFGDQSSGLFAFTTSGRAYQYHKLGAADGVEVSYWKTSWYTWVVSIALAAIGAILAWTSWENRLTLLLIAGFAAAMYGLRDADQTLNLLAAARYGLLAMLAYWLIRAVTRPRLATSSVAFIPGDPKTAVSALGAVIPPPSAAEKPEKKDEGASGQS